MSAKWRDLGIFILLCALGWQLPTWVLITSLVFFLSNVLLLRQHKSKPSRWLTNTLSIVAMVVILLLYRTLANQEASTSFLCLLTSLKLLEERTERDRKIVFLLSFVLLVSLFLFSFEIPAIITGFVCFFLLWTSQNPDVNYRSQFVKALPLTVLLFLFFPRVQNPFGLKGPLSSNTGGSGFSDDLAPGSIAEIRTQRDLAFRVKFTDQNPKTREQYWRGQILRFSEGLKWKRAPQEENALALKPATAADYEVTLEPHLRRWLFALEGTEFISSPDFPLRRKGPFYFEALYPLRERVTYQGSLMSEALPAADNKIDLQVGEDSPRLREFVNSFNFQDKSADQKLKVLLEYFNKQGFAYSKEPGKVDSLEEFLFTSKKGYCEHYAAALASLLRLSEVPARVITGYQGGEYNAYGNFWKFTQADAHAWVEYKNSEGLWQRVDPTSVVAPERLDLGGLLFLEVPENLIGKNQVADFLKNRESFWNRGIDFVLLSLESFNYSVVLFLLDFSLEKQKDLLASYRVYVIPLALFLIALWIGSLFLNGTKLRRSDWLLRELEKKSTHWRLQRQTHETLRAFTQRWSEKAPEHQKTLTNLAHFYETLEYSANSSDVSKSELRKLLRLLQ